jgi:hypothetical protein
VSFSLRYNGNDDEPSGSLNVELKTASFEFEDRSFDWLVIADGLIHAQGVGRLKGSNEDLTFHVIAKDGGTGPDFMRIRITRADGSVVYDNEPGAAFPGAPAVRLDNSNLQLR